MASSGATAQARFVAGAPPRLWILTPWRDLLLFVATPLLLVPVFAVAQTHWTGEGIALFVASFGAIGHHLPGIMRAYGDRALFERFKVRFMLAPLLLGAVCVAFTLRGLSAIALVVYLWGVWHGFMQTYGFLRIYDAKVGSFAQRTARLDLAMCLVWFVAAVILSPTRLPNSLAMFYDSGGPLLPAGAIHALTRITPWALLAVNLLFLANLIASWRRGERPNPVKLLLMTTSFGFWWYSNVWIANALVGIALFEVFHDVQYLSIVWLFNRNRVDRAGNELTRFLRFLFRRSGALVGVYVGLVVAYGSLNYVARGLPTALRAALLGVLAASTLLHFYFDSFIWKVRERSTRKALGLEGGVEAITTRGAPPGLVHSFKWALFAIPVGLLGLAELKGAVPRLERARAMAAALPSIAQVHYRLGRELETEGRVEESVLSLRRAVELDPGSGEAHFHLARALFSLDRTDESITQYQRATALLGDSAMLHNNLAIALVRANRLDEASRQYREAIRLQPDSAEFHFNLGQLLTQTGRAEEAATEHRAALRLNPNLTDAHLALGVLLMDAGATDEAGRHLREALRARPDLVEAHYNLGNLLVAEGRLEEAALEFEAALRVRPDFAEAHHNLGVVLLRRDLPEAAIARFREALRLKPEYVDAHTNLAGALEGLGRHSEATRHRNEAGRLAGRDRSG